jgi:ribosomal protein L32
LPVKETSPTMAALMRSFQTVSVPRLTLLVGPLFADTLGTAVRQNAFQVPAWLGPILWAVPKKKTSHSKKRMRASNKGLKQAENITSCPACGNAKLMHHVCRHCYQEIKHRSKLASL